MNVNAFIDFYWALVWLFMTPSSFSKSSSGPCWDRIIFRPFSSQTSPRISEKAFIKNRNNTGAMLSPCLTPTSWKIVSILFKILSTTIKYWYVLWIVEKNFGGDPYLSSTLTSSLWPLVSKAFTRPTKSTKVGKLWLFFHIQEILDSEEVITATNLGRPTKLKNSMSI